MSALVACRCGCAPARILAWLALCCAPALVGCAGWSLPRIDPTGERLLVPGDLPPPGAVVPGQWGIAVTPSQVIAPVGSEVVMVASVTGPEGFPLTRERVEWMLAPDGAGQFVSPGVRRPWELLTCLRRLPRKIDNNYVVNTTLAGGMMLDRGTPNPDDDLFVQSGQAWVSVTSATEGTSRLTAYAPDVEGWDRHQQSASIYWVDAQWRFPPPAITAAGGRNTLSTVVSRQTNGTPLAGWVVRYDIISGGPPAGFAPDGATSVEVLTGPTGEASAEIFQREPIAGTNQVNIQVIQQAGVGGPARQLPVGSGATTQTWTGGTVPLAAPPTTVVPPTTAPQSPFVAPTLPPSTPPTQTPPPQPQPQPQTPPPTVEPQAPLPAQPAPPAPPAQLEITVRGPTAGQVGNDVTFEIDVVNRGTTPATGVLVSNRFDAGLEHAVASGLIERDLADLPPGGSSRLAVSFHLSRAGELCQDITVTAAGESRATARHCITVAEAPPSEPAAPEPQPLEPKPEAKPLEPAPEPPAPAEAAAKLTVTKEGPDRREVGQTARFVIEVTNLGDTPIENLEVADNFETSLEPAAASRGWQWLQGNALGWKVASLAPRAAQRFEVELKCLRETPRACNRVTVTAPGIKTVADEACLEVAGPAGQAPPPAAAGGEVTLSVAETADPIKTGGQTTYQIVLTNKNDTSVFEAEVSVKFSDELRLEGVGGPLRGSITAGAVRFPALRELRAGESSTFELRFTGARPGTAKVQVEVTSKGQARPTTAQQTTEVLQ